jgi:hypothetical protein
MRSARSLVLAALVLARASIALADHPAREPMLGVEAGVGGGGRGDLGLRAAGWLGADLTRRLAAFAFVQAWGFDRGHDDAAGAGVRLWPWSRVFVEARAGYVLALRDRIGVHDGRRGLCDDGASACGWIAGGAIGVELARADDVAIALRLTGDHADAGALAGDALAVTLAFDLY